MTLEHTPLDLASLAPAVARALSNPASKMMVARGAVPMGPGDTLTTFYQLALDPDAATAEAARAGLAGLPDRVAMAALADVSLDPRVLDWAFSASVKPALVDALIQHPRVADATLAARAGRGNAREVDLIATNEARLLHAPEIIAAMYLNPQARMGTVDRVVELAVRNNVRVPGLAAWDEIARALEGARPSAADDARVATALAALAGDDSALTKGSADDAIVTGDAIGDKGPAEDDAPVEKTFSQMTMAEKIRSATLGNAFVRSHLIRDPIKIVAMAAIKAGGVSDVEAARYASNSSLNEEVIRYIATQGKWTKLYGVKVNLIMNPKTPMAEAARFLPHLRDKDLRNVAKSKGVPSAVAAQAKKVLSNRSSGQKG